MYKFIFLSDDYHLNIRACENGYYEITFSMDDNDDNNSCWFSKYLSPEEAKRLASAILESEK